MNPLDDDTTTRTGLWVVFSTVTILLISVIIWVLKGADGASDAATTTTAAAAVATSAAGHGQDASTTAQGAAGHAVAQDAASSSQTGAITEEFVAFEQATPTQPAGAIYFTSASASLPADTQQAIATVVEALKAVEGRPGVYTATVAATAGTPWGVQILLNGSWTHFFGTQGDGTLRWGRKGTSAPKGWKVGKTYTFMVDLCKGTYTLTEQ